MIQKAFTISQTSPYRVLLGEATVSIVNSTPYDMTFMSPALTGRFTYTPHPISSTVSFDDTMTFMSSGTLNAGNTISPILETSSQNVPSSVENFSSVGMTMTWPDLTGFVSPNPIAWSAALMIYVDGSLVREETFSGTVPESGAPGFTNPGYTLLTGFPVPEKIRFEVVMTYSYRGS